MRRDCMIPIVMALILGGRLLGHDKWESISAGAGSDDAAGFGYGATNVLVHGVVQTHDLEGSLASPDEDWMLVPTTARHSYDARLVGLSGLADYGGCTTCIQFSRVNAGGEILTDQSHPLGPNGAVSVRWTSTETQAGEYLRVRGNTSVAPPTANDQYTIEFFDTTLFGARFNNTATQVTVLFLQNTTRSVVTGAVHFYSASGSLLHSAPLSVPVQGLHVHNTAAIGALSGQGGSLAITHDGGYGGLSGKAVALEPATGFTFDTPLVSLPR
jgi:hypothetical protein